MDGQPKNIGRELIFPLQVTLLIGFNYPTISFLLRKKNNVDILLMFTFSKEIVNNWKQYRKDS